jgi:hypothetical protein
MNEQYIRNNYDLTDLKEIEIFYKDKRYRYTYTKLSDINWNMIERCTLIMKTYRKVKSQSGMIWKTNRICVPII